MRKLNVRKYMHIINGNAVRGRLSENYLTRKFIAQKIFWTRNIRDLRYVSIAISIALINLSFVLLFFFINHGTVQSPSDIYETASNKSHPRVVATL